jgi:hypothetical protein
MDELTSDKKKATASFFWQWLHIRSLLKKPEKGRQECPFSGFFSRLLG